MSGTASPLPASPTIIQGLPHQHRPRPALEEGPRRKYDLVTRALPEGGLVVEIKDDTARVIWSKTRSLTDEEIVETIFDSARNPRWTIHRPVVGWYLVLRSPSLPPSSFISLKPSTTLSPDNFTFTIRSILSFPEPPPLTPTPTDSASPSSSRATNRRSTHINMPLSPTSPTSASPPRPPPTTSSEPTQSHFRLQPSLPKHTHRESSAAWSVSAFTGLFADRGKTFSCVWDDEGEAEVVRYEDAPSLLSFATKGSLYLNQNLINITGMEPSFWIAVSLAYLEFLQDRDAYTAASHG